MHLLVSLAAILGVEVGALTDRIKTLVILNAVIAVFALVGAVFLLIAGFLALTAQVGAINAALIFAGVFLLVAIAVYLGSRISESRHKREVAEKRRTSEAGAFATTAALTALPVILKSPLLRTIGLPAAAVAAFMVIRNSGRNPGR